MYTVFSSRLCHGWSSLSLPCGLSVLYRPVDIVVVYCWQVGARGYDEWGAMFASSMKRSMVGIDKMRVQQGPTGQSQYISLTPALPWVSYLALMPALHQEQISAQI